jgi:hypothetical protein
LRPERHRRTADRDGRERRWRCSVRRRCSDQRGRASTPCSLVPTLVQNPNLRANGWINGSVALTSLNTGATSNGVMIAPAAQAGCATAGALDCGVATTVRMARIAASAAGTVAEARAATASNTPTLPAPSVTNAGYCGIFTYQDALGNEAALPASGTACTVPAAAASTALAANTCCLVLTSPLRRLRTRLLRCRERPPQCRRSLVSSS